MVVDGNGVCAVLATGEMLLQESSIDSFEICTTHSSEDTPMSFGCGFSVDASHGIAKSQRHVKKSKMVFEKSEVGEGLRRFKAKDTGMVRESVAELQDKIK